MRLDHVAVLGLLAACGKDGPPAVAPIEQLPPARTTPPPHASPPHADRCRGVPIPDEQHYVAEGLCARAVALDQGPMRGLTFVPNGDLIGITLDGVIRRFRDANNDGMFRGGPPEIVDWAKTGGSNGTNCHYDQGFLYCGSEDGVKRWRYDGETDRGGDGEDVVTGQPHSGHSAHAVHVYDGWLYVVSASEDNSMSPMPDDYDTKRAVIKRFDTSKFEPGRPFSWADGQVFVRGVRNATAFTRAPNGLMYAAINNLDDLRYEGVDVHQDNPGEVIVPLAIGRAFGWPFCFHAARVVRADGTVVEPGTPLHADVAQAFPPTVLHSTKDDTWCQAHTDRPVTFLQAHTAPLEITFFDGTGDALPRRWKNGAFVTMHGSWDRDPATGYKVVWVPFDQHGRTRMPISTRTSTTYPYEVVFGGGRHNDHRDGPWGWSYDGAGEDPVRPVGVAIGPDGALYVSSDNRSTFSRLGLRRSRGAIYRIVLTEPE